MNLEAKKQYMETLRKEYLKASKKEKGLILDEYCKRTGESRKYAIKKFCYKVKLKKTHERKKKTQKYKGDVVAVLVQIWNIFDNPCGQRLEPLLKSETDKLRKFGEIACSNSVAEQLKTISSATIDRRLKHQKEVQMQNLK